MTEGPILVLLAEHRTEDRKILGLSLAERAARAAERAGFGKVLLMARETSPAAGVIKVADWTDAATLLPPTQTWRLIIAPGAILAETDWLARAAELNEAALWSVASERVVSIAGKVASQALGALEAAKATDLVAVEAALTLRPWLTRPASARL